MADVNWSDDDAVLGLFADNSDDEADFLGFLPQDINAVLAKVPLSDFAPERDVDLPADLEARWTRLDEPPLNAPFTGEAKLMVEMDEFDPIDFFKLFVNDDFLNVIVTETNRYAETRLANDGLPEFSRVKKWRPVDLEEMKVFFGLVIAMGLVQKNDIQDYWSVDETDETPFFSKHMSRDRFLLILSNFHLSLPPEVVEAKSVNSFKSKLNKHWKDFPLKFVPDCYRPEPATDRTSNETDRRGAA